MKLLNGNELAEYIKERQAKQVRNLRQSHGIVPKLVIFKSSNDPVIETYVRMKQRYGDDIELLVEVRDVSADTLIKNIQLANADSMIHGIIVQLPISGTIELDDLLDMVSPSKDVDGLAKYSSFIPATAMAIDWLLNGYNIDLRSKKIAIVGTGRLVGAPLAKLWNGSGINVTTFDEHSGDILKKLRRYSLIVTATGVPGLIQSSSVQPGAVIIDAATSAEHGKIVGDVSSDVRQRTDITITPEKGGVGPLTVAALFDNVIRAARASLDSV